MAGSTVLTAGLLGIAGITGPLLTLLTGLTVSAAKVQMEAIMAAKVIGSVAGRGSQVSYNVDGQSVSFDVAQLEAARALLDRLAGTSGGAGRSIPVSFG
jgi:hypothetical protein